VLGVKMSRYWKSPEEKIWYSFFVDGKRIATLEDSTAVQKEKRRLTNLAGISIKRATSQELIDKNAYTVLPDRIISKMITYARAAERG